MARILNYGRKGISAKDLLGTSSPAPIATSIEKSNDYKASAPANWDGASPAEMQEAIDRLAALLADWSNKFETTDAATLLADYSNKP